MSDCNYNLVLLCVKSNIAEAVRNLSLYKDFLAPKKIVFIARKDLESYVPVDEKISFIDEDSLYQPTKYGAMTYESVLSEISSITNGGDENATKRTGWYFQQFLKLSYAFVCKDENYLVWDSDTVPLHHVQMCADEKNIFDVKTEYNKAYFDTIAKILPGLKKSHDFSFISEHMIFSVPIVKEMIERIEGSSNEPFWKIILRSIDKSQLSGSAFSEFETYGTYVMAFHPEKYEIRKWKSFRDEAVFFPQGISAADFNKLGMKYDAKSFESHASQKKLSKILGRKFFQNRFFITLFLTAKEIAKKIIQKKEY